MNIISDLIEISSCNFTDNEASGTGGAITTNANNKNCMNKATKVKKVKVKMKIKYIT